MVYEFDSGYRLQVPQGLTLEAPLAGGASGGIADGDRILITDSVRTVTFEFDRNGNVLAGNISIPFTLGSTQSEIAQAVATAIGASGLQVTPRILPGGRVFLGAETNVRVNTNFTAMTQPSRKPWRSRFLTSDLVRAESPMVRPSPSATVDARSRLSTTTTPRSAWQHSH